MYKNLHKKVKFCTLTTDNQLNIKLLLMLMLNKHKITEIFVVVGDFYKEFFCRKCGHTK